MTDKNYDELHVSVLLEKLVNSIEIYKQKQNIVIDATLGMAGHAIKIIEQLNPGDMFIGFDADERNLKLARERIGEREGIEIILIHSNFVNLASELAQRGIEKISGIYYDLGISSLHVDEADRGFSFQQDGPLDMRFDASSGQTAAQILNSYTEKDLRRLLLDYGEEPAANKLSRLFIEQRKKKKYETTFDLVSTIELANKHPKTKTRVFQALRIEVNNELRHIETSLQDAITLLESGGDIFVISFHSLEDRIVKNIFRKESKNCICSDLICSCHHKKQLNVLTKKPIIPTDEEIKQNPRSRSAKARHARKI